MPRGRLSFASGFVEAKFFEGLEPCLVGMEACATSHHWARELRALGHDVRLIPPAYVKAYVRRQKNDAADAEAITEAVSRPNMRFVAVREVEPQSVLVLHRTRELLVRQRTMLINALRGHCAEFGMSRRRVRTGRPTSSVRSRLPRHLSCPTSQDLHC